MTALSALDVVRYQAEGILFPYPVLTQGEQDTMREVVADLDRLPAKTRAAVLRHKSHLVSRRLAELCAHPAILDRVESLIGPNILVWGANYFLKEAHSPAYVGWHQDATYWGMEPADIVTAWVALSPSTVQSGCMRVVPRSHLWPIVAHVETFDAENMLSRGQEIAVEVDPAHVRDVTLKPGEMSLHHVKIAHNSEPNRADHRRIGFAIRYVGAHVKPAGADVAMRVRGTDSWGHFDPEAPALGEFLDIDIVRHAGSVGASRIAPRRRI